MSMKISANVASFLPRGQAPELRNSKEPPVFLPSNQTAAATASFEVSISGVGQQQSGQPKISHGSFSPAMMDVMSQTADEAHLKWFLNGIVYEDSTVQGGAGGLLDITDYLSGGQVRYSRNKEPVSAESNAYFNRAEHEYRAQKIALYETALGNGVPLVEIYDKLAELTAKQPARFLSMKGYVD